MLTLLLAMMLQAETPAEPRCAYDREAMLAMEWWAFDQGPDGWRSISNREGCDEAAADLVQTYRAMHGLSDNTTLYVHEAQLRASIGETSRAIDLFELARHDADPFGWNIYMEASIAFLRHDRDALVDARERLATLPITAEFIDEDGNPTEDAADWPMNLHVVDAFVRCFGYDFDTASNNACPD